MPRAGQRLAMPPAAQGAAMSPDAQGPAQAIPPAVHVPGQANPPAFQWASLCSSYPRASQPSGRPRASAGQPSSCPRVSPSQPSIHPRLSQSSSRPRASQSTSHPRWRWGMAIYRLWRTVWQQPTRRRMGHVHCLPQTDPGRQTHKECTPMQHTAYVCHNCESDDDLGVISYSTILIHTGTFVWDLYL